MLKVHFLVSGVGSLKQNDCDTWAYDDHMLRDGMGDIVSDEALTIGMTLGLLIYERNWNNHCAKSLCRKDI